MDPAILLAMGYLTSTRLSRGPKGGRVTSRRGSSELSCIVRLRGKTLQYLKCLRLPVALLLACQPLSSSFNHSKGIRVRCDVLLTAMDLYRHHHRSPESTVQRIGPYGSYRREVHTTAHNAIVREPSAD